MDTDNLLTKFARIGARLKVADRPSRRFRAASGVISLDVQEDRDGEFFEVVRRPETGPGGRRPRRSARRPAPAAAGPGGRREAEVPLRPRRAALVRRRHPRVRPGRHRPPGEGGPQARRGPGRPGSSGGSVPRPATAARTPPTAARASGSSCPSPASPWTRAWCSATSRSAGATAASRTGSSSATGRAGRRSTSAPATRTASPRRSTSGSWPPTPGQGVGLADDAAESGRLRPGERPARRPQDDRPARLAPGPDEHRGPVQGDAERRLPGLMI